MDIAKALRKPDPVPIRVQSRASRKSFAAALDRALGDGRYSDPRGEDLFLRLRDRSATEAYAEFAVRTYVMPGIWSGGGSMDMRVLGSFQDTPIGRWTIRALAGWLVIAAIMTVASGGLFAILVVCGIFIPLAAGAWALSLRHNQRVTPREAGSLFRFLQVIASEAEAERTPQA